MTADNNTESPEELLNRVVQEKVDSKMRDVIQNATDQAKMNDFADMQGKLAGLTDIPEGIKERIESLSKAEYNTENYGELKAYLSSSTAFNNKKTNAYESAPNKQDSGLDYSGSNQHRPKDMTDLSECYQNLDPIGQFGSANIYKVYPDINKNLLSHNRVNALETGDQNAINRIKEEVRTSFDQMMQRDRDNGYMNSLTMV